MMCNDFSFVSAHCASFMKVGSKLRGGGSAYLQVGQSRSLHSFKKSKYYNSRGALNWVSIMLRGTSLSDNRSNSSQSVRLSSHLQTSKLKTSKMQNSTVAARDVSLTPQHSNQNFKHFIQTGNSAKIEQRIEFVVTTRYNIPV